jgi:hypothetical protein
MVTDETVVSEAVATVGGLGWAGQLVTSDALVLPLAFAGTAIGVGTLIDAALVQLLVAAVWGAAATVWLP